MLRGLRFATVGAKPMSTGHRAPHFCSCRGAPKVLVPTTSFSCVVTITFGALIMDIAEYTGLGSHVKRGAFAARSASCALVYGVGLGLPRAAELQPLSRRDPSFLPDAVAYIRTVYVSFISSWIPGLPSSCLYQ